MAQGQYSQRSAQNPFGDLASLSVTEICAVLIILGPVAAGVLTRIETLRTKLLQVLLEHSVLVQGEILVAVPSIDAGLDLPRALIAAGALLGALWVLYKAAVTRLRYRVLRLRSMQRLAGTAREPEL